ncbi:MAG: hypothetical protein VX737_04240 [Pseudomonadota bacterium]|nr:hypothetical protein [Pseudomonadota bacterium]
MKFCFDILTCLKNTIVGLFVTHRERSDEAPIETSDDINKLLLDIRSLLDLDKEYVQSIELQNLNKTNESKTDGDMGCIRRPSHGDSQSTDMTSPMPIHSSSMTNPMLNNPQGNATQLYSPPRTPQRTPPRTPQRTPPRTPLGDLTNSGFKVLTEENLANHSNELSSSNPGMPFGKMDLTASPGSTCSSFSSQSSDFSVF